ncbi:MAG TPA: hypothetical protein VHE34_28545 [Puia sp.]|uniref:hypothetical protein n=1 Tax=Puia sp. TaxID=2045100 RepID=UPI002C3F9DA8|nr:hypothetical protein [Puia sp.]HVU99218.1 hypothetical protein [Puia sp.]
MPLIAFLLLLLCYLVTGYGILFLFRIQLKPAYTVTLSLLLGLAVASFLPFLLQLLYIGITPFSVFGSLALAAVAFGGPVLYHIRKQGFAAFRQSLPRPSLQVRPYEIPFFVIIGFLIFVSVWRAWYLPPTSRDALSGPEAIAQVAISEHTLVNSFFGIDLWTTNNQFKSPFLISLQVIYKLAGFPFGQIWLSILFVSITVFIYHALRERLHPLLAGLLLLLFIMTPEMYAYTFMILYDYSNMIFFFLSLYFLFAWTGTGAANQFFFSGVLMGIATYIRSETLALALLFLPLILLVQRKRKMPVQQILVAIGLFLLPSFLGYYLPSQLYINHYLPVHYDIGGLVNNDLTSFRPLFQRYGDIFNRLLTGEIAIHLWGYIFYLTAILFLAEAIVLRRFNREARNWLYAIVVLYIGLGALGWLLPMMNLNETTKRAMFKMLPLVLFYLANNELLIRFSQTISRWENTPGKWGLAAAPASPNSGKPAPAPTRSVLTKSGKKTVTPVASRRKKK